MKVLVTGASGFVGAHSSAALQADGRELRLLVRDRDKARRIGAAVGLRDPELVDGDITDAASVRAALAGCDAVLHAAGAVSVERKHAAEALAVNEAGAENVLREAADLGLAPIVHVSSTSALAPGAGPLRVDAPVAQSVGYAASKAAAERVARELQADGAPLHITYPAGIVGPAAGDALGETSRGMARFVAGGLLPTRHGALSLIDVRDVAEVHRLLLAGRSTPEQRVMCGGAMLTMADLQWEVGALTGRRFPITPLPPAALRGIGRAVDRLAARLPIDPALTEEAMTLITEWRGTEDNAPTGLGVTYRPIAETLETALDAWLAAGLLTPRQRGTSRRPDPTRSTPSPKAP